MGITDRFRAAFGMKPRPTTAPLQPARFSAVLPVDQLLHHLETRMGRIDRAAALSVPAVLRGRNMICSIATLPLECVDDGNRVVRRPLLEQHDANVPNVVVIAQLLEDLLMESVSWWRVTGFDGEGMPSRVQRYAPDQVSLQPPDDYQRGHLPSGLPTEGVVWMEGRAVPFAEVIRFDSPNPALLGPGAKAIRRALALDEAAELYAKTPRRRGYFVPTEGADPADDDVVEQILTDWADNSARRVDGYVPAALKYEAIQDSTPAELQLVQMQKQAGLDLANALSVDPEDLGISTTSRVYQNATDRRQDRINDVLSAYMRAITDRLNMPDVTPPGQRTRFGLDEYMRADPKTRAEVHAIYHGLGATDSPEIREEEGWPARTITAPAVAAPAVRPAVPAAREPVS
ncbi:MAG TPA: phage portal protein [Actinoplanes sp.]|nr:phage portal protein [Actinoplanes sp.]